MRTLFRFAFFLTLALVGTVLLIPYSSLEHLQNRNLWMGSTALWLDTRWPGLDLDHSAAFATLGLLMALAQVRVRLRWAVATLVAAAVLTELVQLAVPGRSPQVSDAVLDVLGGGAGYALGRLLVASAARTRRR